MKLGQLMKYDICYKLSKVCFKDIDVNMQVLKFKNELVKNILFVEEEINKINNIENASKEEKIKLGEDLFELDVIYPLTGLMLTQDDFSSDNCYLSHNKESWLSADEINCIIDWCKRYNNITE